MNQDLTELCNLYQEMNFQRHKIDYVVRKLVKNDKITPEEGFERLQKFYDDLRTIYRHDIDILAEDSTLMQSVLSEETTYEEEAEKFENVLKPTFWQKVKYLFKNPQYDEEHFEQLKQDMVNLSGLFSLKRCSIESNVGLNYKSPTSRAKWTRGFIRYGTIGVSISGILSAIVIGADIGSEANATIATSIISGIGGVGALEMGILNLISNFDNYEKFHSRAEKIDLSLNEVYSNK